MESGYYRRVFGVQGWEGGMCLEPGKESAYCSQGGNLWLRSIHILIYPFTVASLFLRLFKFVGFSSCYAKKILFF